MTYLNEQERLKLLDELKQMTFNRAKGKLRHLDPKARLVYYRNSQQVGRWLTRYNLESLGTDVTLVEANRVIHEGKDDKLENQWELVEVIVEPAPDNRL
ncbi:MAG TPA: hypothetical protein VHO69_15995 [Phototrophicaceae bacterium]|nr:hypothetical protein [Phototrophicaceae bacterium]